MRVLIVSQYFPPETGGPQNRLISLAEGLGAAGHEVHVITEKPNYPTGVIWDEYRGGAFVRRSFNGIPVLYTWIWEDQHKRFLTRIRFYFSFVVMAILAATRLDGRFDIVLASSPPLFVGLSGWVISRLKRAKFVFDVRDLWPDVAIAMGELTNPRAVRLAKAMERFIYAKADGITAVTESFCEDIRRTAGHKKRVIRVTNGTVPEHFLVQEEQAVLRRRLDLPERYIVTYAGNLGLAQGLDHILDAASLAGPDVLFVFVGEGAAKERLQVRANELQVENVWFRPRVELAEAAAYMAASDALLVPLASDGIYRKFIPSKLFDSMAASKPVLLAVDGESRRILEEANAGLFYPPEDAAALASAVRELMADRAAAEERGRCGALYAASNFSRAAEARKMAAFIEEIALPVASPSAIR